MKGWAALVLMAAVFIPPTVLAQSTPISTIHVAFPILHPGQTQTVTVFARDLRGRPLVGARSRAKVQIGTRSASYSMKATDRTGKTILVLHPSSSLLNVRVSIHISVTNGFISIPLIAAFTIRPATTSQTPTGTPTRTATPVRTPTGTSKKASPTPTRTTLAPTATAVPTPTGVASTGQLVLEPKAVPSSVTAPSPAWIVVYAHSASGSDVSGVIVRAVAPFAEGVVSASGETDSSGVASIMIDTSEVRSAQTVSVSVSAQNGDQIDSSSTGLTVGVQGPTATPTPTPTPPSTPVSLSTPLSTPTSTPVPTATLVPTSTPTPTATPTNTPIPNCPGDMQACMQVMLGILNQTRAQYGVAPLTLSQPQSLGTGNCVGSLGHSQAMQDSSTRYYHQVVSWHTDPHYPNASFSADICLPASWYGENVGAAGMGGEIKDLQYMHTLMMSEQHDPAYCATHNNHACNILSTKFSVVGIGIVNDGQSTWLTEDFLG